MDLRGSKRDDTCRIAVGSEAGNSIKVVTLSLTYKKLQDIIFSPLASILVSLISRSVFSIRSYAYTSIPWARQKTTRLN